MTSKSKLISDPIDILGCKDITSTNDTKHYKLTPNPNGKYVLKDNELDQYLQFLIFAAKFGIFAITNSDSSKISDSYRFETLDSTNEFLNYYSESLKNFKVTKLI